MNNMKKTGLFFLLLLALFTFSKNLSAQEWLGIIIPIQTTLSQVNEMVNTPPKIIREDKVLFELK